MSNTIISCPFTLTESTSRVLWEVTGKCNLNCQHCLYYSNLKETPPDITFEQMVNILDSIVQDGHIKAIWISGGEPLLYRDLVRFANEISKRGIIPSISTNGTLLTDKLAAKLFEAGVRYVHLSIDGTTAEVHDKLRNTQGAFDAVMRGIDFLKKNNINVGASYMVTWDSVVQVPDMVRLCIKKGLDVVSFYPVAPIGRGVLSKDDREFELMCILDNLLKPYLELDNLKIEVFRTVSEKNNDNNLTGLMECKGSCFYTITNDGYLSSCPWFAKHDSPIKSICLTKTGFSTARQLINKRMEDFLCDRKKRLIDNCMNCDYNETCGKGCPAVSTTYGLDSLCRYLK